MILLLRGHIRDSFNNNDLYNLLADISDIVDELEIYIQTWNVLQSNMSWREIEQDDTIVDEYLIRNYFRRLNIKNIIMAQIRKIVVFLHFVSFELYPYLHWWIPCLVYRYLGGFL